MNWIQATKEQPGNVGPVLICYLEERGPTFFTALYSNGKWYRAYVEYGLIRHDLTPLKMSPDFWMEIEPPVVSELVASRAH